MTTRDISQQNALKAVIKANYIAGIEAATGWGKTRVGLNIIESYKPKSLLIVVPTRNLKSDWENHLKSRDLDGNVMVINSACKSIDQYDMLLLDEAHRVPSKQWIVLLDNIKYNKLVWLTATIERSDGRHTLLLKKAPLVFKVTLEECIANKWTSDLVIRKLPVKLTDKEKNTLSNLNSTYNTLSVELRRNPFKSAQYFISFLNIKLWFKGNISGKLYTDNSLKNILEKKGIDIIKEDWYNNLKQNKFRSLTKLEKEELFEKALIAKKWYQVVGKRKSFLYNVEDKINLTLKLLKEPKKTIVFSQEIAFLERLYSVLGDNVSLYHSKLSNKVKRENLDNFKNDVTNVILAAESLNEGMNVENLERAIITSYTSSKIKSIQRKGRIIRKYKDKIAEIIFLYVPDSQEVKWLQQIT